MQLANKIIVVTGAGSGMGREMTLQLLKKNAKVVGVDIHENALVETQKLAGVGDDCFKGFQLDISNKEKVEALPAAVIAHFGSVDGLINNAGIIQKFIPVNELSYEDIQRVMNVNFYGMVYLTKSFLPHFLTRPEAHIVNISSMGGFIPFPGQTIYGAAKAAVKLFTEGLYAELKETNVKVTVVHPGAIATNITENSGLGKPKGDPATQTKMALPAPKAAALILRAIEKNSYRITVGKDATILDILYRLNPRFATNFIRKMMKKAVGNM
ncbi:SDR family oxidoreductase [Runella sp. SP2]|uniref:SDR family NAD(P)-dependent oxidoreductase n=1 Tax=Runella sp. SP2 TaxID=2268026 RepID=UPI000F09804A|nr:SDR family oxidoreductase [Runella sp. SP2]AYQ31819.1 SDR family NAD(P)-dependent oxidoreductase [Runella sp. SP2]